MDTKFLQLTGLATLLLVMTACAVVQPFPIPADNPTLASVQANIDANKNHHVAWGGVILGIEVKQTSSMITMPLAFAIFLLHRDAHSILRVSSTWEGMNTKREGICNALI